VNSVRSIRPISAAPQRAVLLAVGGQLLQDQRWRDGAVTDRANDVQYRASG
jgi:hypothetical protein